jgi:hypothetical protein
VATKRDTCHSAVSLASSFAVENDCDWSAPAGSPAWAVIKDATKRVEPTLARFYSFFRVRNVFASEPQFDKAFTLMKVTA